MDHEFPGIEVVETQVKNIFYTFRILTCKNILSNVKTSWAKRVIEQ